MKGDAMFDANTADGSLSDDLREVSHEKEADLLEMMRELEQARDDLEARLHNEATYSLLVSRVKDYAIFLLDASGRVMTWNEGARRINGYKDSEIIGKHFSIFYPQEARDSHHPEKELEIATREGRYEEEGLRVRKDGSVFWADVLITALFDESGELVGFAKVARDLTERKNNEEFREQLYSKLASANEELQQIAYVISHELQEPLSNITSYSNLLSVRYKGRLGDDADEFLSRINDSARLTALLVDDLWTYARVTRLDVTRVPINTGIVLRDSIDELDDMIKQIDCRVVHPPLETFPTIDANREQLTYVFKEILSNSIKHFGGKSATLRIKIDAVPEQNGWSFSFDDNGPGIDKFFAQQVFDIYQKLSGKPDLTGTGMGLPICKKIVEQQHRGRIGFESSGGKGTTFYIWLPETAR